MSVAFPLITYGGFRLGGIQDMRVAYQPGWPGSHLNVMYTRQGSNSTFRYCMLRQVETVFVCAGRFDAESCKQKEDKKGGGSIRYVRSFGRPLDVRYPGWHALRDHCINSRIESKSSVGNIFLAKCRG